MLPDSSSNRYNGVGIEAGFIYHVEALKTSYEARAMKTSMHRRRFFLTTCGLAIVAVSFFGTMFLLDFMDRRSRDALRIETAKSIMAALAKYRASKGAYPLLTPLDSPMVGLANSLVGNGYLTAIPPNPIGSDPSRYVSVDGTAYGLLIYLEGSGACRVEVGASKTGWWGQPPPCLL
jgi:hypothetical protein